MGPRSRITAIFHPLLLGLYPLLFLLERNPGQASHADVMEAFGWTLLALVVLLIILFHLLRSHTRALERATLLVSTLALGTLLYGPLVAATALSKAGPGLGLSNLTVTVPELVTFVCVALLFFFGVRLIVRCHWGHIANLTNIFSALALVLALMPLGGLASRALRERLVPSALPPVTTFEKLTATKALPDTYYIILDGLARPDVLKALFNVDPQPFVEGLQKLGFWVAPASRSNYPVTLLSLASSLNGEYLEQIVRPWDRESSRELPIMAALKRAAVPRFYARAGHAIRAYPSSYAPTELVDPAYLYPDARMNLFAAFGLGYIQLPWVREFISEKLHARYRGMILKTLNALAQEGRVAGPKFVFSHIINPHPPFIFRTTGDLLAPGQIFSQGDGEHYGEREQYRVRYGEQAQFITGRVLETVTQILATSPVRPTIIIQSDHGSGLFAELRSRSGTNYAERFANFTAILGAPGQSLPDDITPVNIFRSLVQGSTDHEMPLLPERSYFSPLSRPYELHDVTDEVTAGLK